MTPVSHDYDTLRLFIQDEDNRIYCSSDDERDMPALISHYLSDSDLSTDYQCPASWWAWHEEASGASDGTSASHCSRRSEDTENPHWSSWWGGWGFMNAYLEDECKDDYDVEAWDEAAALAEFDCMQRAAAF